MWGRFFVNADGETFSFLSFIFGNFYYLCKEFTRMRVDEM